MQEYKSKFIGFLLGTGALKVGGDYSLKNKRNSPRKLLTRGLPILSQISSPTTAPDRGNSAAILL